MASLKHYYSLEQEALLRCKVSKRHGKRKPRMHGKPVVIKGNAAQAFMYEATAMLHRNIVEKEFGYDMLPDYKLK